MALKNFNEQKFRKKDGMPYGFKADRASSIQEQQIDDAELQRNDYENRIAEARKARNNPSMQRLLASDEYQQKQREYSQRAIELAKANAGDDRITAYKKPQTVSDYSGLGTLPTYSGMNTAANGADIDYTEVNKKAAENGKGWKGFGNSNEETISQEEALKNATRTVEPYIKDKEVKQILDRYVEVSNAHDQAKATTGLRWFKNIDKAMWGSTLDEPKQQLIEKTGLSDEEADKLLRHYKYYANNQLHEEQRKAIDELPTSAKVALTPLASMEKITGNFLGGIAVKDSDTKDPELGRDYNSASFGFRNLGNDIKESLHEDINESNLADWQKTALNKGYDVGTMAGESFVTALYPGKVGLLSYGTGSYADNLQEAENRGLTKGQAQTYATTMGIAEVATEAIPFNHLSNLIKNGAGKDAVKGSLKPVFKEVLVQMNEEGTEELANDVIDVIADSLINQDKSKLNISINNYMAEGLSKDEATSKAYKDIALQAADDYLTGALSGGLSAGAAVGVYTGQTTSIGRDIAKNNEYLTKDTESPYYISENKEDYDSDASYEQAQATRQELISAADKLANKQKISGQEARAIYQDTTDVLENKRIQTENRAQRAAVEKIEAATTPLELETAIEKARVNTEAVQQAAETKKTELKMNGAKEEDFANAITPQRALEQGRNGQEISEALLKELPEETQIAYQYGKISHDLNIGKDISKADVTDVWIEDAKNKRQQIEQVKYNNKGQLTFVTNQGVEVSAYDANYSDKGEQLYKSENGILSLQDPELIKIAIDAEAAGKHDYPIASLTKAIKTMDTLGRTQGVDFNSAIKSSGYQYMESVVGREVLEQAFNAHKDISETFDEAKKTGAVKAGKGVVTTRTEENAEAYDRQFDNEDIAAFINTENRNRQSIRGTKKIVNDAAEAERVFEDLSDVQKLFLESFSKKAKVDFNFIYTKEGETRGAYQPEAGKIILNLAYGNDMFEVALHEGIGEFLQAHNAEDYNKITSSILNYYASTQTDELAENIRAYQNAYKNKHYRESFNELANDAMAKIFSTDEGLTELINWLDINETAEQAKTVKKTFLDYFKDFKQMIADIIKNGGLKNESLKELNIAKDQAADYAKQLTKAMSKAVANRDAQVNQEGQSSTRKSIKLSEVEFDADGVPVIQSNIFTNAELKNFRQLNNTIKAELQTLIGKQLTISSDNRVVDIAGDFAKEYTGSNDTWNNRAAIRKAKANAISGIKQIVESATNPQWMENTEDKHESDAKRGWTYYDVNFGIKGADSINYYTGILNVRMDEDGKDYLYDITLIRKRNVPLTRSDSTQNVPTKDIITSESKNTTDKMQKNSEKSVNIVQGPKSIKVDTNGRSLSEGQQNYFSNSKVVDEKGNLIVVYHGSPNKFTEFKHEFIGSTGAAEGKGFYFTNNRSMAEGYSRSNDLHVLEGYLDIKKPLSLEKITLTKTELKKYLAEVDPTGDEILSDYDTAGGEGYPSKAWYNRALNDTVNAMFSFNENDADIAAEIFNMLDKDGLLKFKEILGYDGFIAKDKYPDAEVYVAFDSNQFKNVDNLNPTENPDIKYSIKVDTEDRSLSDNQQAFYADEHPAFIENGALKTYYHGTKHAGFTTFSLNRMDDKQSIFFTDNKDVAQTYSGVAEMFVPDKEWSFDELAAAIENVTNGDWELKKVDAGYELVEYEVDNDKTSKFKSLKDAQSYFIDYMNNQDFISKDSAANYKVYLHATNPLVVDAKGAEWNNLPATNYARHLKDVTIQSNSGEYQIDYAEKGKYKQEIFDSLKELEKKFGRFPESFGFGELYFTDLYLDKNNNRIPTNTREYADYAKNNGYDSLVINNVIDTDIYGDAINKTSQIAVVFNPNQVKSVYNENPTSDADIRKSIKVDWDNQVIDIPARTFNDDVFFSGTDEEIADAEKQEVTIKAYYANLMDSKGFRGFTFSFKDGRGDMQERILTRSTREGVDWQYSKRRNGLPVGHDNYINENDDIYSYAIWPNNTLAALYNELLADTPKDGQRVYVIREGAAEEARKSVKVFGESSPYAESIKQTEYVSQVLSTLNNQLKGTSVSMKYLDETVKYIMDKYQANLNTEDLKMELAQFIGYMTTQENVDYNQMMNYLLNIGDEVIEASQLKDPESVRIYDKLKKEVSSYKIRLTKAERKELISRFGGEWKTAFGKLNQVGIKLDNKNGQVMDAGIYQALSEKFRQVAGVYLDESTTPVDQIATIIDAMDALSPSLYEWDGANKMDKALDVATTIIDRYYSMASSIKESNIVKGTEKGNAAIERAKQAEIKKLRAKQAEYKNKLNEEFQALVEDKKKMLQEQQEFYRKQAAIEKKFKGEQKAFNKKVDMSEKELAKTARVMAKMEYQGIKDTEAKRKQKENIVRTSTRLINWMNKPTDARHVPTFLKPALTDMIKAIDFMPASMRKGDDGTISAKKWQDSMQKLQLVIKSLENVESENDSDKYQLSVVMQVEDIVNNMDELLRKNGGIADISKMSKEDLKTLSDIMTSISRAISQMNESFMNKRFSHISGAAKASMNEMDELKPYDEKADVGKDTFGDFLNIEMLEPISFFEELGKASESIMQEFFDGEKIGIEIIKEADTFFDNLSKELKVSKKNLRTWQEDVKPYTIDGVKLYLTSADIMSLYCSYKRELKDQEERPTEATHHIAAGGIKGYRQRIKFTWYNRNPRVAHATQADVLELINSLTEAQQAYADKVVEYMSTTLAEHGNETSNKLNGYSKFLGKYYFPLKTDNNAIATNESNNMSDNVAFRRLINQSFTKSQLDKADNALVLMNFFDVVTEHITGMSNYCAYSMPISDALRWYNYTETERENTDIENEYQRTTVSVKGSMDRVKGDGARKYFEQFIRDVNLDNKPTGTKLSKLITQGLTGFAKAKAVGLNIRVILQQPCAIVRAADVIEGKYLATGWAKMSSNPKKACDYAQNTNWLAYWKSKGMSDTRVSQSMKEIITGSNSKRQDIVEKTGVLAGWADDITWASMYYAAEAKIKATTNLEGEEYRTAVDELYSDIINHTQVIDSQLRKTGTMRSKSELEILANAFKKEPQKSYNMLHRKWWNLQQANYTGANVNKAKKEMHKALTIFMENAFLTAIAQSLVDAWRDDDEEEKYLVKLLHKMYPYESYQAILDFIEVLNDPEKKTGAKQVWNLVTGVWGGTGNVIDNANLFSSMPYVADINSFLQGYQVTRLDNMSLLNQIKNSMNALSSSTATPYSITYALAQLIGYGTGVGADNALKDLRGIYNQFAAPHTGVYIDKSSKRAEQRNKEKNTARATEVFNSNDLKAIDAEIVNTYNKAIESGKDESQSWGAARTMLKEQYKRQFSEHPEQAAALNNRYATLVSKTKHKVSGNYEYYTVEQAQKKFIDDWYEDMTN